MFSASDVKELREKTGAGMLDCKKALQESEGNMEKAVDWLREKGISKAAKKESRIAAEGLSEILVDGNKAVILEINSETDFVAKNAEFTNFVSLLAKVVLDNCPKTMEEAMELPMSDGTVNSSLINLIAKIGEKISFRRFEIVEKNDNQVFGVYNHQNLGKINVITILDGDNSEIARDVAMHVAAMNPGYLSRSDVPEDVINHEKDVIKKQAIEEGKPAEIAEKMVNGRINKFYKEVCLLEQPFIKDPDLDVAGYAKANNMAVVKFVRFEVGEGMEKRNDDFASEVMSQING
ncbi:MAG: translation elongation factor Ts [Bacilli bacterium]|nr:translation elongation factor Ts [Bacilli bacterium]